MAICLLGLPFGGLGRRLRWLGALLVCAHCGVVVSLHLPSGHFVFPDVDRCGLRFLEQLPPFLRLFGVIALYAAAFCHCVASAVFLHFYTT